MTSNDPASREAHAHLGLVHADADACDDLLAAQPVERHIGAGHRLAKPLLDRVGAMGPDIDVMDQQQIDAVGAEPQQRLLHRTHRAVIGIVDHGPMRLAADKSGTVAAPVKRIHPATDLGAEHDVVARHAPERRAAAMFGQAMAIERRGVEQIDAERERALHRGDRRAVVELP